MTPPNATPTRADVLREPNALTALAEACERAAWIIGEVLSSCGCYRSANANAQCSRCTRNFRIKQRIDAHARALREGRVTVNEGGENG